MILIRIHKGGWVFNGNVAEFSIDKYRMFCLRKTNVKQVIIIKKNGINLHVIQQKEKTFLQNTDRICTRIDRFPGKRDFEDWEKKPRVIRYSRFFKYLPSAGSRLSAPS